MAYIQTRPDRELIARLTFPYYNPRKYPLVIPAARWDDGPCWCLYVNDEWASHVLGILDLLDQPDTWQGDEAEIFAARRQVNEMITCFMESSMGCGCNEPKVITNTRFLADGTMQVSYDGGMTWEDAPPGVDPRYSGGISPPIAGDNGDGKRCKAASSATEVIKDNQEQVANDAALWAGLTTMITALLALLVFLEVLTVGTLTPLILPFAAALLSAGQAAFVAAFNDDVWAIVQCAIYCNTTPDAAPYTAADVVAIRAKIASQLTGVAALYIDYVLNLWGATGLTNASRVGFINDFDCSSCECTPGCHTDSWAIYANDGTHGTDLQTGVDGTGPYIQLTANVLLSGHYYAILTLPNNAICCRWNSFAYVGSAPAGGGGFGTPCGSVSGAFQTFGTLPQDRCVWQAQVQATQPFVVKFYFGDCT